MVSLREPKIEVLKDIQKTHGLLIPHGLHILHNKDPLESPLPVNFSLLIYIMSPIAIENVLTLVDTLSSNRTPSNVLSKGQTGVALFLYPDILVPLHIQI